ncbi:MAG: 30S ribosomal protein S20 [Candidatus Poribacteria bacterium]|nr:30S ribosomal protein S20 [Candidatus Poribacteria bacterium]MDE0506360.1 30S ribosomal protein S20 [Candidatus Poribacteria bacterium]
MAHRKSAMKHIRADQRKAEVNRRRKVTLRTTLKKTEAAIAAGDSELAQGLYRQASGRLDRAAQKGVIKRGEAARRKSRLSQKLNDMSAD